MSDGRLEVFRSRSVRRNQRWRWRLIVNHRSVAESGEGYANRAEAIKMARRVVAGAYRRDTRLIVEGQDRGFVDNTVAP